MKCRNDCIRPLVGVLAVIILLGSALTRVSDRALSVPAKSQTVDADLPQSEDQQPTVENARGIAVPSSWLTQLRLSDARRISSNQTHRIAYIVAALVASVCLVATSIVLLLLVRKSHSPSIISLLRLLCILMLANGTTCLLHLATIWWPVYQVDAAMKTIAAFVSVAIVVGLLWKLPRSISFHGRASLKSAEKELRLSKERFDRALQGSSNGLWEWNIEAGEVWFAPRFRELLGYEDWEFPNELSSWESALHPDDKKATLTALEMHLSNAEAFDVEYRLKTKCGEYRWFHARGVAIRDPTGKPYLMAGSIQDIHDRKQAQDSLRERDEQIRHSQKLEAVGTLAGGIAHEFNNLIQAIQGYTTYAMKGLEADSQRREDLEQVLIASRRAASLTKQLLGFSRRQVLKLEPVHANSLMEELVRLIRPLIGEHVTIEVELDPASPIIQADAGQVQQLIMNLCINARDAMPAGGTLTLTSRFVDHTDENVNRPNDGKRQFVAISVSDTGCGIPPENKPHIFEPFFTTKGVGKGTGLGLAMAYGIVQQHQGVVHVDSQVNVGTTVTVYLPHSESAAHCPTNVAHHLAYPGTETILIAEDDPIVRNLAVRILTQAGYRTLTAMDGETAVTLFQENIDEISLIVLDVTMPILSGHEALRQIRLIKPDVLAVMCTGYDPETTDAYHYLDSDVPLIQKPFEPDALLQVVREVLDRELCEQI